MGWFACWNNSQYVAQCNASVLFHLLLSAFVHVVVSGSATRQECLPPPTTAATHGQSLQAVGHPPGNTGNGVLMCTRA